MSRNLRAIIEWTDKGPEVKTIESFDLPPRTGLEMAFPLPLEPKPIGTIEETVVLISAYRCLDCDFQSESFDVMMEHQNTGRHSFKTKIKRILGL
jgi:hypothetical protein